MMKLMVLAFVSGPHKFFTSKPFACDPASLPQYPPSKEFDAKLREEEARRKRAAGGKGPTEASRRQGSRECSKANPAPDANAELEASLQKRRIHPHSSKSKSEKFAPPNEDTAVGFLIETPGTSQPFEEAHPKMTARHKSGIPTGSSRFKPVAAPGSKKLKNDEASTVPMQPVSEGLKSVTISDVSCEHGQRTATEFSNSSLGAASHLSGAEHSKDMGEAISNMESNGLKHDLFETSNKKSHHLSSSRADKMDRKVKEVFPKQGEFSKLHKIADSCYQIDVDNRRDVKMSSKGKHGLEQTERIYHSGPLIRSGYASMDVEELLKDHECKMQQAARRAAQETS